MGFLFSKPRYRVERYEAYEEKLSYEQREWLEWLCVVCGYGISTPTADQA